ncbi:MAG: hypothetical protein ABI618_18115, partial [Nitrospirota bacterium]
SMCCLHALNGLNHQCNLIVKPKIFEFEQAYKTVLRNRLIKHTIHLVKRLSLSRIRHAHE